MSPVSLPSDRFEARTTNFWEFNPHLKSLKTFRKLVKMDAEYPQTEGETSWSSRVMWAIYYESDPDEELNPFISLETPEIREELTGSLFDDLAPAPYDMEVFGEANDLYTDICMSPIERALRDEIRAMQTRARKIRETELVLDKSFPIYKTVRLKIYGSNPEAQWEDLYRRGLIRCIPDYCAVCGEGDGFLLTDMLDKKADIKGTASQIEAMRKATPGLVKAYAKLEAEFRSSKADTHVYGNQTESLTDKGLI